jgi:hypothetical protein
VPSEMNSTTTTTPMPHRVRAQRHRTHGPVPNTDRRELKSIGLCVCVCVPQHLTENCAMPGKERAVCGEESERGWRDDERARIRQRTPGQGWVLSRIAPVTMATEAGASHSTMLTVLGVNKRGAVPGCEVACPHRCLCREHQRKNVCNFPRRARRAIL